MINLKFKSKGTTDQPKSKEKMSSKVHKVYAVLALSVVSVENTVPTKFDLRYIIPFGDKSTSVIYSSTKNK